MFSATALADPTDVQRATYVESADSPLKAKKADRQPPAKPPHDSLPLPPRGATREAENDKAHPGRAIKPASGIATGMASLAVVLALFLAAAWAVRRGMPAGPAKLPGEVVEVLGRTPLTGRQFAHLIRCGNKLLLVYLAPGCAETLTEITDPVEVDRLAGLCRQVHPHSATTSFRQVFQQFSRERK
ncbi:MAG TPA: flagellar biosynthetic protein FliO [Pirellulales bacterium]|nr:flagellar biosynthetic protein FliO [Pirellulales bacterium]